ncbi:MAG: M1 family aminopeptidase [Candidatus Neomarinimicrobiota bacterium]
MRPRPVLPILGLISLLSCGNVWAQQVLPTREELLEMRRLEINARQAALERQRLLKATKLSPAQQNYDVTYYRINLDIDTTTKQISGTVTMTARAKVDDFTSVELDLAGNMSVDAVGGDAAGYTRAGDLLVVELSQPVSNDEYFNVSTTYHGQPAKSGFGAFGFDYHEEEPIIWSLSEPYGARAWWPCKDAPSDKADSVDMIVTVPGGLIVASNGMLVSEVCLDSGCTFHWQERYPITTYLVSLAITNYATYSEWFHYTAGDSMEIQYYIYPEDLEQARNEFTETLDMLAYFHEIFGPYPFLTEKYGIAQFAWGGGMEHQTITSQGRFRLILTVHELAHQWWGDKITNANWHEIWLNEGFASYAEALYFEHSLGTDYYHEYMSMMDRDYLYPIYVDDTTSVSRIFDITVYDKAGWFLHMLRHIVGDSTFFDILLAYSNDPRFAYSNATTGGFQDVCETVSDQDLDWFFQPWIYEAGRPEYKVVWGAGTTNGLELISIRIDQVQYPEKALFPMPIDIAIDMTGADTIITVFNNAPTDQYYFNLPAPPLAVTLDPEGWILKKIDTLMVEPWVPIYYALYQNVPNPFNTATSIATSIPYELPLNSDVKLVIYDLLGRKVTSMRALDCGPGRHEFIWRGIDHRGIPVASGIYLYRIEMSELGSGSRIRFSQTRKMVLLR